MVQVIVFTNENGGVSVCTPTGEVPIETVLANDCPPGAIIINDSDLPTGSDVQFFNAWELSSSTVSVNFAKAQAFRLKQFNTFAVQAAQKRQLDTLAGIPNDISDEEFANQLKVGREAIANATTTTELASITDPA